MPRNEGVKEFTPKEASAIVHFQKLVHEANKYEVDLAQGKEILSYTRPDQYGNRQLLGKVTERTVYLMREKAADNYADKFRDKPHLKDAADRIVKREREEVQPKYPEDVQKLNKLYEESVDESEAA